MPAQELEEEDPWLWVQRDMANCDSWWIIYMLFLKVFYDNLLSAPEPKPRFEDFSVAELLESAEQFMVDYSLHSVSGYELYYGPVRRWRWPTVSNERCQ